MLKHFGMGSNVELSKSEINIEMNLILEQATKIANKILHKNQHCIETIVEILIKEKVINKKQIDDIFMSTINNE